MWDTNAETITVRAEAPVVHAEPVALATLAAWAAFQRSRGKKIIVDDSLKSPYAWRYGVLSSIAGHPPPLTDASRYIPPTVIKAEAEHPQFLAKIAPILRLTNEQQGRAVRRCLAEIIRNVEEHSGTNLGATVCCSHFPESDRVSLAVVDTGDGIPKDIRRKHGSTLTDASAIHAAVQWRVSGESATKENAGVGLYYVRATSTFTGGMFSVVSSSGFVRSSRLDESELGAPKVSWRGTIVAVSFRPADAERAWRVTEEKLAALDNPKTQPVAWGPAPPGVKSVKIAVSHGGFAEDKSYAKQIRETIIVPEVEAGRAVAVDLTDAKIVTHSFVHALLHEAFLIVRGTKERLIIVHAKEAQVRDMVRIVARYATDDES